MPTYPPSSSTGIGLSMGISPGAPPRSAMPSILGRGIVHAWSIAGGATIPPKRVLAANSSSRYTGLREHRRRRDDPAETSARGELFVEIHGIAVVESVYPMSNHRHVDGIGRHRRRTHRLPDILFEPGSKLIYFFVCHRVLYRDLTGLR